MVGVQAGHLGRRCWRVQLFRVQAIVTQGAADGVLGQRENSPVVSSVLPAEIKPFDRRVSTASAMEYRRLPFLRVASRSVADISGFVAAQNAAPGVSAFCVCQSLIPPSACAAGWRRLCQFSAGGVVYCTALTMPRVTCRAGNINQSFSQGGTHRLCLLPVNLWRRVSEP